MTNKYHVIKDKVIEEEQEKEELDQVNGSWHVIIVLLLYEGMEMFVSILYI